MKKHLQKLTTLKTSRFLTLTVLRSYGLMVFLFLPFSAWADKNWSGAQYFFNDETINENINLTGDVYIAVMEGKTLTINGKIYSSNPNYGIGKSNKGTLVLNGKNTYTGETVISEGILKMGNSGSIYSSREVFLEMDGKLQILAGNIGIKKISPALDGSKNTEIIIGNGAKLSIEAGDFPGTISGAGSLVKISPNTLKLSGKTSYTGETEIKGGILHLKTLGYILETSSGVTFTGNNTKLEIGHDSYGTTVIKNLNSIYPDSEILCQTERLYIGTYNNGGTNDDGGGNFAGKFTGNIVVKYGTRTLTITGAWKISTYLNIDAGTFKVGNNGTIDKGRISVLSKAKLEITKDLTIRALFSYTDNDDCEVFLDNFSTLTITSFGNVGGFTGTGNVIYTNESLSSGGGLYSHSKATGTFKVAGGTVDFGVESKNVSWAGNFEQSAGTKLNIINKVIVGKGLRLNGGEIMMNLTGAKPSKIQVTEKLSATGTTKLNLTISGPVTDYELITADSGIDDASKFVPIVPAGYDAKLTATGTQLLLTVTTGDGTPPDPGSGAITCTATATSATLKWAAATDNVTLPGKLRYFVYRSTSNNISNPADCAANGKLLNSGGTVNITTYNDKGLSSGTSYYYNVVVADEANNKAAYNAVKAITKVGIEPITNDELRITVYPNPTTGKLRITNDELRIVNVEIYDVFGRKVYDDKNSYGLTVLRSYGLTVLRSYDLTVFPAGIYFLKITTETGIVTKKIVKQ